MHLQNSDTSKLLYLKQGERWDWPKQYNWTRSIEILLRENHRLFRPIVIRVGGWFAAHLIRQKYSPSILARGIARRN